jgi:hypothetical protein
MGSAEAVRVFARGELRHNSSRTEGRVERGEGTMAGSFRSPSAEHSTGNFQPTVKLRRSIPEELRESLPFRGRHGVQAMLAHDALGFLNRH